MTNGWAYIVQKSDIIAAIKNKHFYLRLHKGDDQNKQLRGHAVAIVKVGMTIAATDNVIDKIAAFDGTLRNWLNSSELRVGADTRHVWVWEKIYIIDDAKELPIVECGKGVQSVPLEWKQAINHGQIRLTEVSIVNNYPQHVSGLLKNDYHMVVCPAKGDCFYIAYGLNTTSYGTKWTRSQLRELLQQITHNYCEEIDKLTLGQREVLANALASTKSICKLLQEGEWNNRLNDLALGYFSNVLGFNPVIYDKGTGFQRSVAVQIKFVFGRKPILLVASSNHYDALLQEQTTVYGSLKEWLKGSRDWSDCKIGHQWTTHKKRGPKKS